MRNKSGQKSKAELQKADQRSKESKSPGIALLTPVQATGRTNEDVSGMYERHSLLQSSDNLSGIKLQENPTAHLASSSQHSFHAQDVSASLAEGL